MDKSFEMKIDEETFVDSDGWGRHKAEEEVINKYFLLVVCTISQYCVLICFIRWKMPMNPWKIHKKSFQNVFQSFAHQITSWNQAFLRSSKGKQYTAPGHMLLLLSFLFVVRFV